MSEYTVKYRIGVDTGTSAESLDRVSKSAEHADEKLSKMAADGSGSNSAAFALTNFNRVLQDLPYGFIGIANNIDPLVSSFQKLKGETGSVGGAFKAMLGMLSGPTGVLFAVNAAVMVFQLLPGILKKVSGETDETTGKLKKMKAAVVEKTFAEDADIKKLIMQQIQIQAVSAALAAGTLEVQSKKYWINKLNNEYKPYLGQLKNHKVDEDNLSIALNNVNIQLATKLNNMIMEKVLVKMADALAVQMTKILELRTQTEGITKEYNALRDKYGLSDADIRNAINQKKQMAQSAISQGGVPSQYDSKPWLSTADDLLTKIRKNLTEIDNMGVIYESGIKEITKLTAGSNFQFGETSPDATPKPTASSSGSSKPSKEETKEKKDPLLELIKESLAARPDRLNKIYAEKIARANERRASPEYRYKDPFYYPPSKNRDTSLDDYNPASDPFGTAFSKIEISVIKLDNFFQKLIKSIVTTVDLTGSLKKGFEAAGDAVTKNIADNAVVFKEANSLLEIFINNLVRAAAQAMSLSIMRTAFSFLGGNIPFLSFLLPEARNTTGTGLSATEMIANRKISVELAPVEFKQSGYDLRAVVQKVNQKIAYER